MTTAADRPDEPPQPVVRPVLTATLQALESAGVPYCLRNGRRGLVIGPGEDVDVLVRPRDRRRAGRELARQGWRLLRAPGHCGHDFWVRLDPAPGIDADGERAVLKIDLVTALRYGPQRRPVDEVVDRAVKDGPVWTASPEDAAFHAAQRALDRREVRTGRERLQRKLPLSWRRRGPVIAVLGPDGAGKGTVVAGLRTALPVATSTAYLGIRRRPGGPAPSTRPDDPRTQHPPVVLRPRELAFLTLKWLRSLKPMARAYLAAWRGHVVLLDRHPLDALAVRPRRSLVGARLERVLCQALTPRPDAVLVLDAPGEVFYARKGEHSPELLEMWRQGYRRLPVPGLHLLDATQSPSRVLDEALTVVWQTLAARRGWPGDAR